MVCGNFLYIALGVATHMMPENFLVLWNITKWRYKDGKDSKVAHVQYVHVDTLTFALLFPHHCCKVEDGEMHF